MTDRTALRRQDFWTALVLIAASLFFLWKTQEIPFFRAVAAGVEAGYWYNSAALVPYGIFAGILLLAIALLANAIRQGGAPRSLSDIAHSPGPGVLQEHACWRQRSSCWPTSFAWCRGSISFWRVRSFS